MTMEEKRAKEIKQAGNEYVKHFFDELEVTIDNFPTDAIICRNDFIHGAKWSDAHPKKGMVDIEKVVDYIANNMRCDGYTLQTKAKFIKELRKAMVEENNLNL